MGRMLTDRSTSLFESRLLRRGPLSLLSVLVAGTLGAACSAGPGSEPETEEVPSAVDEDGDKVVDSLGKSVDKDGDGVADLWDHNADGTPDGIGVDTNGDGEPDAIGFDTNGDGIIDALDTDLDGEPDVFATVEVPVGDGDGDGGDGDIQIGDGDGDGDGPTGPYCDEFDYEFVPKTPTVYVLVDQSQSMFEATDFWNKLKAGVLPVIQELAPDVRFGFGSYTGTGASCNGLMEGAPIAIDNYSAIETAYNALGFVNGGQTPTPLAVLQAKDVLLADESPGDRFILLVSDGSPDFCDDPDPKCGYDALIAALQIAYSEGVRTLVFGIENTGVTQTTFDYFAQAGMGELPNMPEGVNTNSGMNNCSGGTGDGAWANFRTLNGGTAATGAGKYSAEGGTATAFLNADPAALATEIRSQVEGLKSCSIDMNFDVVNASKGDIFVHDLDNAIPRDQWEVSGASTSTINLLGAACDLWQQPDVKDFFAGFPCDAIVVK